LFVSIGPALLVDVPRDKNITGNEPLFVIFSFLGISFFPFKMKTSTFGGRGDAASKFQYRLFNFLPAASSYVMTDEITCCIVWYSD
jgi:hypothetical protein